MEIFREIIINIILLFGLVFIISLSNTTISFKSKRSDIFLGIIIGFITIFIMMNAWQMTTGTFFDTRSVMIGVTSLFFSYYTSFIAASIAVLYRIYIGGAGVYAGVLSILFPLIIGWIWKKYIHQKLQLKPLVKYYLFGVVIHLFVILSQFTFPFPDSLTVIKNVGWVIIVFYPIATMLLCLAIINHENRIKSREKIIQSEKKYRTLIDNSKFGIVQYNHQGIVEIVNDAIADMISIKKDKVLGMNLFNLPNKQVVKHIKISLDGHLSVFNDYYTSTISGKKLPLRAQFSPIYENKDIVGGIGIIEDLTKEHENIKKINHLMTFDRLTKLKNRTTFDEFILNQENIENMPISIIIFDINSLHIFNTSFGYDVGNQVLLEVSEIMKSTMLSHANSNVYRIGGDEFAIILTKTDVDEAKLFAESIKQKVKQIQSFDFDVSISYGVDETKSKHKSLSETYNQALAHMSSNKIYDGSSISTKTIDLIMATLFEKSKRERIHSERVSQIAKAIAKEYNLGTAFTNRVELAGRLHDIGKINIPEDILDKPEKLNASEWIKIKKHPESGFRILSTVPEYLDIANIVLTHHERFDGKGYPKGISGHDIPLESRIIGLADAYDAMTEERPYRMPLTEEEALKEIMEHRGTQFDPDVVDKFFIYINRS